MRVYEQILYKVSNSFRFMCKHHTQCCQCCGLPSELDFFSFEMDCRRSKNCWAGKLGHFSSVHPKQLFIFFTFVSFLSILAFCVTKRNHDLNRAIWRIAFWAKVDDPNLK